MKRGIRLCRKNVILSVFFIVITIASLWQPVTARAAAKPVFDKQTLTLNVKKSKTEAGKSVMDYLNGNILYINVMNRLSVDCDSSPAKPCMHDIGILASYDPVALDQACVDLVYAAEDGAKLVKRIESRNGLHTLEHAEKIGLGSRKYKMKSID